MSWFKAKTIVAFLVFFGCTSAGQEPAPSKPLYDESKVPAFTLPDPLITQSDKKVTDAKMWKEKRRPEIVKLFEEHVYGRTMIGRPKEMTWEVTAENREGMFDKGISKTVNIYFAGKEDGPSMRLDIRLPKSEKPVPLYMITDFERFNRKVLDRGYGMILCNLRQIQADAPDSYAESIRAFFAPGQKQAGPDEWGAIGVWAWAMSRAMDYVETDKDID